MQEQWKDIPGYEGRYLSIDEQGLKQCALPLLSHRKAGG